jgi:hypothetical protein
MAHEQPINLRVRRVLSTRHRRASTPNCSTKVPTSDRCPPCTGPDSHHDMRTRAAQLFRQGKSQADVVRELEVSRQSVSRWQAHWQAGEANALRRVGSPGRPRLLDQRNGGGSSTDSRRATVQRICHRHVDSRACGRGDRGRDGGALSPGPSVACSARDVPPTAGPTSGRT